MRVTLAKLLAAAVKDNYEFKAGKIDPSQYLVWVDKYQVGYFFYIQGLHRLEKYLKMKGCLEKYLKTKFALKSAGKLAIGLEKHLNFTSSGIPDNKIRFHNQM